MVMPFIHEAKECEVRHLGENIRGERFYISFKMPMAYPNVK